MPTSKTLDEILDTEDWDSDPEGNEFRVYDKVDKDQIKALFRELVGEDEDYRGNSSPVNDFKAELREKIDQL